MKLYKSGLGGWLTKDKGVRVDTWKLYNQIQKLNILNIFNNNNMNMTISLSALLG